MNAALLVITVAIVPAAAQLREVEMRVSGLDCSSCGDSVVRTIGRIRGVEKVKFRDNTAVIHFAQENKVTLARLRDAMKGMGYTPESAKVTVRGDLQKSGTVWLLQSPSEIFEVSAHDLPKPGEATITGIVRPPQKPNDREKLEAGEPR